MNQHPGNNSRVDNYVFSVIPIRMRFRKVVVIFLVSCQVLSIASFFPDRSDASTRASNHRNIESIQASVTTSTTTPQPPLWYKFAEYGPLFKDGSRWIVSFYSSDLTGKCYYRLRQWHSTHYFGSFYYFEEDTEIFSWRFASEYRKCLSRLAQAGTDNTVPPNFNIHITGTTIPQLVRVSNYGSSPLRGKLGKYWSISFYLSHHTGRCYYRMHRRGNSIDRGPFHYLEKDTVLFSYSTSEYYQTCISKLPSPTTTIYTYSTLNTIPQPSDAINFDTGPIYVRNGYIWYVKFYLSHNTQSCYYQLIQRIHGSVHGRLPTDAEWEIGGSEITGPLQIFEKDAVIHSSHFRLKYQACKHRLARSSRSSSTITTTTTTPLNTTPTVLSISSSTSNPGTVASIGAGTSSSTMQIPATVTSTGVSTTISPTTPFTLCDPLSDPSNCYLSYGDTGVTESGVRFVVVRMLLWDTNIEEWASCVFEYREFIDYSRIGAVIDLEPRQQDTEFCDRILHHWPHPDASSTTLLPTTASTTTVVTVPTISKTISISTSTSISSTSDSSSNTMSSVLPVDIPAELPFSSPSTSYNDVPSVNSSSSTSIAIFKATSTTTVPTASVTPANPELFPGSSTEPATSHLLPAVSSTVTSVHPTISSSTSVGSATVSTILVTSSLLEATSFTVLGLSTTSTSISDLDDLELPPWRCDMQYAAGLYCLQYGKVDYDGSGYPYREYALLLWDPYVGDWYSCYVESVYILDEEYDDVPEQPLHEYEVERCRHWVRENRVRHVYPTPSITTPTSISSSAVPTNTTLRVSTTSNSVVSSITTPPPTISTTPSTTTLSTVPTSQLSRTSTSNPIEVTSISTDLTINSGGPITSSSSSVPLVIAPVVLSASVVPRPVSRNPVVSVQAAKHRHSHLAISTSTTTVESSTSLASNTMSTVSSTQYLNNPNERTELQVQVQNDQEHSDQLGRMEPVTRLTKASIPLMSSRQLLTRKARDISFTDTTNVAAEQLLNSAFLDHLDSTHRQNIEQIAEMGITQGCNPPHNTQYCPDRTITRAEIATLLTNTLDLPPTNVDYFSDTIGNTHQQNINRLASAQLTQGCNPPHYTRYCPDRSITRAEIATLLASAFDLPTPSVPNPYTDTDGNTHQQQITAITQAGITQGCNPPHNTQYCPNRPLTRAEIATILVRVRLFIATTG